MNRFVALLKIVLLVSVCLPVYLQALVPDVYLGASYVEKDSSVKFGGIEKDNFNNNAYLLSVGIRPIELPIFSGFRVEGQFSNSFSGNNQSKESGLVLYYDLLRVIPIINPYIGIGVHGVKYDFVSSADTDEKNVLYTFHAGLTARIPALPIDVFAEYRYGFTPGSVTEEDVSSYKVRSNDVMFGIRYYLIG